MAENEVLIFHDDPDVVELITLLCEQSGLYVLAGATGFDQAIFELERFGAQAAAIFTDGNLTRGMMAGEEGEQVAERARELNPQVVVAAISGENQPWSDFPTANLLETRAMGIISLVLAKLAK